MTVSHVQEASSIQEGFSWHKCHKRSLAKQLYRATRLSCINIDYQIQHPNECRNNPDKTNKHCHPDAVKRITHEHEKHIQATITPTVIRPSRPSRNVI